MIWCHFIGKNFCFPDLHGDDGIRTHDPLLAGQVLSQLSYTPIWYCGSDSFFEPASMLSIATWDFVLFSFKNAVPARRGFPANEHISLTEN